MGSSYESDRLSRARIHRMFSRPPGLAQSLASEIEELIGTRSLRSGDRIATMEELRAQTGYGRATIGETARLLTERGSVEVRPGRGGGLFVAHASPVVRLRQTLLTVPQGAATVADAIAVRDALEELIALDAAANRTEQDIRDLEECLQEMRRDDDLEHFLHANWSLHERIAAVTPNHVARAMYVSVMRCIEELSVRADRAAPATPSDYLARRLAVHEELVAAIRLGDKERTRTAIEAHRGDDASAVAGSDWSRPSAAVTSALAVIPAETEVVTVTRPGPAASDGERIAALEQENQELRRANEILKSASVFFAAELNRVQR